MTTQPEFIKPRNDEHLVEIAADAAMNAMALHIQRALGVDDGGVAGVFFSGEHEDTLQQMARDLIRSERNFMKDA